MISKSGRKQAITASVAVISMLAWLAHASSNGRHAGFSLRVPSFLPPDTTVQDTTRNRPYQPSRRPTYQPRDRRGDPFSNRTSSSPLLLDLPSNIKTNVELEDSMRYFEISETVGDLEYRNPSTMSFEEYSRYQQQQAIRNYWRTKAAGQDGESVVGSKRIIPKIYISSAFDRIFGGNYVDIRPNGNVTLRFGARFNRNFNTALPLRQQRIGDFEFDQNITLNMIGQIGEKLKLSFNWDTKANFEFENNMKLEYTGYDEEIIRKIEAGNVSLPLNNSLISGGQNLFGIKTQLQFGRLGVTTIASNVRGRVDEVNIQNGAQSRNFEIRASDYERDRHYFLSHFFRNRYDNSLRTLPLVNSGITIRRMEVYITNDNRSTENLRNIVALADLGEADPEVLIDKSLVNSPPAIPTDNKSNRLYNELVTAGARARDNNDVDTYLQGRGYRKAEHFEHVRARRLDPREYKFNPQLGYISLSSPLLPEQVLGVAYEYTLNGKTYKVGELQDDYQSVGEGQVIYMKMLKSTSPSLQLPIWDLMMKNIYSLNASQVSRDNFQLNVIYKDDETGVDITSLKAGQNLADIPLVQVFNLDNVNRNNDRPSDGNFDFLPGITIDPETGKIIFPVVEPFGSFLERKFVAGAEDNLIEYYVYNALYDSTQSDAKQVTSKDKFFLQGRYQATATDEIMLPGIQIAEGSVTVYSGGTKLQEGVDYQVQYNLGRVKILNPSYLNSASNLRVAFEKAEIINVQPRTLMGARFDYMLNPDFTVGGTVLHLAERPFVYRVGIGEEPTNNTIYGLDLNYRRESRFLTKMVDKLPIVQTKVPSLITINSEFAQLLPGKSKLKGEDGVSYIDDFENVKTPYTLGGFNTANWRLGSTPFVPGDLYGANLQGRDYAFSRSKLAWYTIDQIYYTGSSRKPSNIATADLKNHYVRPVLKRELFPNRDPEIANTNEYTFDIAYYPKERGMYNYSPDVQADGKRFDLGKVNVKRNYGAISREITFDTDFDNANVEYLEFWMMDPFLTGTNGEINDNEFPMDPVTGKRAGDLIFNLGNVSEDLMKDNNRYEFENGLPTGNDVEATTTPTPWGRVTDLQFLTDAFDNNSGARARQDIGLDGLNDSDERAFFSGIYSNLEDPSNDNFKHHLNADYTTRNVKILGRYKNMNGMEGNSPENSVEASYTFPDKEDLNKDNIISDLERYFEYRVRLAQDSMAIGMNPYIVDQVTNDVNGDPVSWFQFRIPIRSPLARKVNGISSFKSIRFLRMYLTNFEQPVILRMVQFQFVANQWRKFLSPITDGNKPCIGLCDNVVDAFDVAAVNVEENGATNGQNIPYVLPPGTVRQDDFASQNRRRLNEQSMSICVENLKDGFGKAVYKNVSMDMLIYKRLKMFIHAESANNGTADNQMRAFIRIGTDYTQNYYEYSIPLKITPQGPAFDARAIWPLENEINVAFDQFIEVKSQRNKAGAPRNQPFTQMLDGKLITIVGNPDFSAVQGVMIGVLNPKDNNLSQSVCIWVNELRVSDFDKSDDGWAATTRVNAKLADLADITATGRYTAAGFGSIQQKIAQRARENTLQFDVNGNIVADKFLPTSIGMKVPVTVQYSVLESEPRYDPLEGDMDLDKSLEKFTDPEKKAEYRREVVTRTTTKSVSLLNVRKEKLNPNSKPKLYDIENLSVSYAYSERLHTDIITDRDLTKVYTGGLAYTYNATPKNYAPFEQSKFLSSPYLKPLKELNATFMPSRLAFRADLDRRYNELQLQRRTDPFAIPTPRGIPTTFQKSFYFNRIYDLKWDLTRALSFDYTATNRAIIDELYGEDRPENNRVIWENLKDFGRNTNFDQTAALNYRLPLDKFPLTDWLSADTRYAATYTWTASSNALNAVSDTATSQLQLGNAIQNNAEVSVNGRVDMVKLYNKVKFLNKINNEQPKTVQKAAIPVRPAPGTKPTDVGKPAKDTTKAPELKALKAILRGLMTARTLNGTYTRSEGSLLPGYLPRTKFFGFDEGFDAPGIGFIAGRQYGLDELYNRASSNGWYTDSSQYLQTPLSSLKNWNLTLRTELQPIRNFNILVDARKNVSEIKEVFYRRPINDTTGFAIPGVPAGPQNPINTGSMNVSTITIRTAFERVSESRGYSSAAFDKFIENRRIIQQQLLADPLTNPNPVPGDSSFKANSQDVLIPAFLFAYQGRDISGYKTERAKAADLVKRIPLPNWRIDYTGLSDLEFVKRYLSSISLSHGYTSTYSVNNFTSSLAYETQNLGFPSVKNERGEFVPFYVVSQVTLVEALTPLLGVNFKTKNNITGRLEYKTSRNLALNLSNAQVTENRIKDFVIGGGYSTSNFRIPFRINGEYKTLKNELTARLDVSFRDNLIVQHIIVEENAGGTITERSRNEVTNGNLQILIRPTVDYTLNQRLNLQLYFTRTISDPHISTSFKNTVTEGGVQLRYSLSQ